MLFLAWMTCQWQHPLPGLLASRHRPRHLARDQNKDVNIDDLTGIPSNREATILNLPNNICPTNKSIALTGTFIVVLRCNNSHWRIWKYFPMVLKSLLHSSKRGSGSIMTHCRAAVGRRQAATNYLLDRLYQGDLTQHRDCCVPIELYIFLSISSFVWPAPLIDWTSFI